MNEYIDFFKELNGFNNLMFDVNLCERAMDNGLIKINDTTNGLSCIVSTDLLGDVLNDNRLTLKSIRQEYKNIQDENEKKKKLDELTLFMNCDKCELAETAENLSGLYFGNCGTRKLKNMIVENFNDDFVGSLYVYKKIGNYSIALLKPWWME